ncbi:TIGR02117 family protein [Kiritimatiellaeota bacterium B1221]|nr:TIGR02117 family protein [Kiritimatiellaeota bacterium B1221]
MDKIIRSEYGFRILAVVFALLFVGCGTTPKVVHGGETNPHAVRDQVIYVHNHGRHTGISLPAEVVNPQFPELAIRFPDAGFYEIGWGDAGFYQAEKITSRMTLSAVFWPTETVLHVVGYREHPLRYFRSSENQDVYLSREGLEGMIQFISSSFARNTEGHLRPVREGIYGDSQFFRGVGKYYLFNTCNKWTAKALASGGVNIGVAWKITSGSVMRGL